MKSRSTKTVARKRHARCPVAILAAEANTLICADTMIEQRDLEKKPQEGDYALGLHIADRLEAIKEQASHTLARSVTGAAFQIMLASSEVEQLIEAEDVTEQ